MVDGNTYDEEFYKKKAEHMRSFIDYSNLKRTPIDMPKKAIVEEIYKRVPFPTRLWTRDKKIYIARILAMCEKVQEEAFMKGANSVYTINGTLEVKKKKSKPINNNVSTNFKRTPPKLKIEYKPSRKIRLLNEALRKMSYIGVPLEELQKTTLEAKDEEQKKDEDNEGNEK